MLPLGLPLHHWGRGVEQGEFVRSRVSAGGIIPPLGVLQRVFCLQTRTYQLPGTAGGGLPAC